MSEIQVANLWFSSGKTHGVLGTTADVVTIRTGSSDRLLVNTTVFSVNGMNVVVGNSTVNATVNSTILQISNSTSTSNVTPLGLSVGNTVVNSSFFTIGNSTVNTFCNGSHLDITSNTGLLLGTFSATANGYTYLPNGLIMQWGAVSANSTVGNATFPIAFPTACLSVTANRQVIGANGFCAVVGTNTTVAQIRSANTVAATCFYMAIGY